MTNAEPYSTPGGVENAIKDAAQRAAADDPQLSTDKRIRLEYFNRFLSRVFSEGNDSEWVLKGGTGILVRVPAARSTRDIDLYHQSLPLDEALKSLIRLAALDLGDHFRFEYHRHSPTSRTPTQPYTDGLRVTFTIYVGLSNKGRLQVDVAVGSGCDEAIPVLTPATSLDLPRLVNHDYRLIPVSNQIADKVCATLSLYDGQASSREKDLIDLVVLASTQDIEGSSLQAAIDGETRRRKMAPAKEFSVPTGWGPGYVKSSRYVPFCTDYPTVELARDLVARLVNPALTGEALGKTWSHTTLTWI